MTEKDAQRLADYTAAHHPCLQVLMIARGVDLLTERNLPIPAWTIPNHNWLVLVRHRDFEGVEVIGQEQDREVVNVLDGVRAYQMRRGNRLITNRITTTMRTWRCRFHE